MSSRETTLEHDTSVTPGVRAAPVERAVQEPRRQWSLRHWLLAASTTLLVAFNLYAMSYYAATPGVRVRHAWHTLLKPSGPVGQSAGLAAFLIFIFLWLYPLRKNYRALAFTGHIARWLDVHVVAALTLPLLLLTHAGWRADGLIGLGLVAMFIVIASGVVGRYLYVRIPRARSGVELTRDEASAERATVLLRLADATGLPTDTLDVLLRTDSDAAAPGIAGTLRALVLNDVTRGRRVRDLRRRWTAAGLPRPLSGGALREAVALADQEIKLEQQARMLDATQRVFRYWHVAHRPFAVTALVAVVIHVAVVVALGATWFW